MHPAVFVFDHRCILHYVCANCYKRSHFILSVDVGSRCLTLSDQVWYPASRQGSVGATCKSRSTDGRWGGPQKCKGTERKTQSMDHRCMLRLSAKARWFHHHQSWQWLPHGQGQRFFSLRLGDLKSVGCQDSSCFFPTCYYVSFLVLFLINMKWFLGCWLITVPLPRLCAIMEGRTTHSQTPGPTQDKSGANRCQNRQMDE